MTPSNDPPLSTAQRLGLTLAGVLSILLTIIAFFATFATYSAWSFSGDNQALAVFIGSILVCLALGYLTYFLFAKTRTRLPAAEKPDYCQGCGQPVPTMKASLNRHIGAVVLMFHKSSSGYFCKTCIEKRFWEFTPITLLLGWWGIISFFITPIVLINNVIVYLRSRSLGNRPPSPDTVMSV